MLANTAVQHVNSTIHLPAVISASYNQLGILFRKSNVSIEKDGFIERLAASFTCLMVPILARHRVKEALMAHTQVVEWAGS